MGFKYITSHGLGGGMMPRDVDLLSWKETANWKTIIELNRELTAQEMHDYDIHYTHDSEQEA